MDCWAAASGADSDSISPQRRRRQRALRISAVRASSIGPDGRSSARMDSSRAVQMDCSWGRTKSRVEKRPDLVAFWAVDALPCSVRGPVECWALAWLAASFADEVDMAYPSGLRIRVVSRVMGRYCGGFTESKGNKSFSSW